MTFSVHPSHIPPAHKRSEFAKYAVGEEFFVPTRNRLIVAYNYGHRNDKQFMARKTEGGWRMWRVR